MSPNGRREKWVKVLWMRQSFVPVRIVSRNSFVEGGGSIGSEGSNCTRNKRYRSGFSKIVEVAYPIRYLPTSPPSKM